MAYFLLISALLLSGCASNTPLRFYMLNAETDQAAKASTSAFDEQLVLGVGPIHVPDYLDRPQIVVAVGENQYRLDEQHRWAERLDQNIGRALAQLVADQTGVEQVVRFPWSQKQRIDYQISVDILAFHQTAGGNSQLLAQWRVKHQDQAALGKRFDCSVAAKDDADAIVKAQSVCLGRLGLDIVTGLRGMVSGR
ncbi:MAG: PqiC family protein [Methylococcaceae bacterium]|nr:PqiC family protein [Methylococcaceae bacterium]